MTKSSICFQGQVLSGAGYLCLSFHSILAPRGALPQHLFPLSIAVKQTTPHLEEPIATTILDPELHGWETQKVPSGDGSSLLWDVWDSRSHCPAGVFFISLEVGLMAGDRLSRD